MFLTDALKRSYISDYIYKPTGRLTQVSGFESEYPGQIIEGLDIWAFDNPVILNHKVQFRDCRIRYANGRALIVNEAAADSEIYNLNVGYMGNPRTSPPFAVGEGREAFYFDTVTGLSVSRIKFNGGTLGIFGQNCSELKLSNIQAADIFGNGLLSLTDCPEVLLDSFSMVNNPDLCFTEDLIKLYGCDGAVLRNGLLDGSNSVNGYIFNFEQSGNCLVEDVDLVHMGNGVLTNNCFTNIFRNVRMRDFHATGKGSRSAPAHPELFSFEYVDVDTQSGTKWLNCKYYNIPSVVDPETDLPSYTLHDQVEIEEEDFTPVEPLNQSWIWEEVLQGPFALILINNDGGDVVTIDQNFPLDTVIAKIFYESSYIVDDAVFTIVYDEFDKFYLDGNELVTKKLFYYDQTPHTTLTIRAENSMGKSFQQTFVIELDAAIGDAPPNHVFVFNSMTASSEISALPDFLHNFVLREGVEVTAAFINDQLFILNHPVLTLTTIDAQSYINVGPGPVVMEAQFEIVSSNIAQQHVFSFNTLEAEFYVISRPFNYFDFNNMTAEFFIQYLDGFQSNKYMPLTSFEIESYVAINYMNLTNITSTSSISELEIDS